MNMAQLRNLTFEEYQNMAPHITPDDDLNCSDLLDEAIRRRYEAKDEARYEANIIFEEKKEELELNHESLIELKDDEIVALKGRIEELESQLDAERKQKAELHEVIDNASDTVKTCILNLGGSVE